MYERTRQKMYERLERKCMYRKDQIDQINVVDKDQTRQKMYERLEDFIENCMTRQKMYDQIEM